MEITTMTCAPSASFVASSSLLPVGSNPVPVVGPRSRSTVTSAPQSVGVVGVDVVRERIAAYDVKVGAFAGDRAFGLALRPRSVPV
jgi:hypothetical protein